MTIVISFLTPLGLVGALLLVLLGISQISPLSSFSQSSIARIQDFLAVFGSGHTLQGLFVIGLASSVVGALFDVFNFYRYQSLRGQ
ncbi:MAG: hypothetical protein MJA27_27045 [Pseudanabaenales cyanobacterium]|nr:hypothetical protein [Pseudanabaenales cyanobacterium]